MLDAVVISDTRPGSDNRQAKYLVHFLESVRRGPMAARKLVLNGDVFDSIDFRCDRDKVIDGGRDWAETGPGRRPSPHRGVPR